MARALLHLIGNEFHSDYDSLSVNHRNTVSLALTYIRRELLARDNVDFGRRPEELFREYRMGSQLDLMQLKRMRLSEDGRILLGNYEENIREYGTNALAHACLSGNVLRSLRRAGVETIHAAEHVLRSGATIPRLNQENVTELSQALSEWRRLHDEISSESNMSGQIDSEGRPS